MKEQILFVSKGGDRYDDGFSYALELASSMGTDITMLIVEPRNIGKAFEETLMTAAFAEEGDHRTAQELLADAGQEIRGHAMPKMDELSRRCAERNVGFSGRCFTGTVDAAVRRFLQENPSIDMILLSPTINGKKKAVDIKRLLKYVAKPIVTLTRPAAAEA